MKYESRTASSLTLVCLFTLIFTVAYSDSGNKYQQIDIEHYNERAVMPNENTFFTLSR